VRRNPGTWTYSENSKIRIIILAIGLQRRWLVTTPGQMTDDHWWTLLGNPLRLQLGQSVGQNTPNDHLALDEL
jgi:hypothetical protein